MKNVTISFDDLPLNYTARTFDLYDFTQLPDWARHLRIFFLLIITVLGVPGNGCLCLLFIRKAKKSSTDYMLLTMAILELLWSGLAPSLNLVRTGSWWTNMATPGFCKALTFMAYWFGMSLKILFACIAVDRYLKSCRPFDTILTVKKAKLASVISVLIGILLAIPTLLFYTLDENNECGHNSEFIQLYKRFLLIVVFVVLLTVSFSYLNVVIIVRKQHKRSIKRHIVNGRLPTSKGSSSFGEWKFRKTNRKIVPAKSSDMRSVPDNGSHSDIINTTLDTSAMSNISTTTAFIGKCSRETIGVRSVLTSEKIISSDIICNQGNKNYGKRLDTTAQVLDVRSQHSPSSISTAVSEEETGSGSARRRHLVLPSASSKNDEQVTSLIREEQRVNRTTWTLFLITAVHFFVYFIQFIFAIPSISKSNKVPAVLARYFSQTIDLAFCALNPLLFIGLQPKFRTNLKEIICQYRR